MTPALMSGHSSIAKTDLTVWQEIQYNACLGWPCCHILADGIQYDRKVSGYWQTHLLVSGADQVKHKLTDVMLYETSTTQMQKKKRKKLLLS